MSTGMSGSAFTPSPSDCESVSSVAPSRSPSPEVHENRFLSAASMTGVKLADRFLFHYEQPMRSSRYWFEDGSTVIEVENTWYNVHGSIMKRQSGVFRKKLSNTASDREHPIGSARQPLVLDIAKHDFELLLSLIYPSEFCMQPDFSVDEWFGIANAATTLEFNSIRRAALESIFDSCGALELINLGQKHGIPECVASGLRILCFAEEALSVKDGHNIGMEMVIQIARARELLAKGRKWSELEHELMV